MMNNQKKSVHKSGNVASLLDDPELETLFNNPSLNSEVEPHEHTYEIESGIQFHLKELLKVSVDDIEPWEYANRDVGDFGSIIELRDSIEKIGQQQPAVIRNHPNQSSVYKYQLIFGRRRFEACKQTKDRKIIVIYKHGLSNDEALRLQHAENEYRKNVSNYSNAILYNKLLNDGLYSSLADLAKALDISRPSLYDIFAFMQIPQSILDLIPNIHPLSTLLAKEIASLASKPENLEKLLQIAPEIGITIKSVKSLQDRFAKQDNAEVISPIKFKDGKGNVVFIMKHDQRGNVICRFNKKYLNDEKLEQAKQALQDIFV